MKKIIFITLALLVASCQAEKKPIQIIYGKWRGAKWITNGIERPIEQVKLIQFEFLPDSTYKTQMGMMSETGTFNLRNNCFNAMSIYGYSKKCPIIRLDKDTMVWIMDSVQQPGNLYLVRIKK